MGAKPHTLPRWLPCSVPCLQVDGWVGEWTPDSLTVSLSEVFMGDMGIQFAP